jgi:hypothetical protein
MKLRKHFLSFLLPLPLLLGGCGSASNDQGVSFMLLGFGELTIDETTRVVTCSDTIFTNGLVVPLSETIEGAGSVIACLVMQNNMSKVHVRTERVNLSYSIAGASEQPPSTSTSGTIVLGPVQAATGGTSGVTGVTTGGIPSKGTLKANIIPPAIREWLSINRDSLPPAPFSMDVMVSVTGVSTAGDQISTNDSFLQVTITNDIPVDPGAGGDGEPTPEPTVAPE